MRFLGIDFGTRKVGLALSDEEGQMAFPLRVIVVSNDLANNIADIVKKESVGAVVMGDSRNFKGEENPLMKKVHTFKKELSERVDVPIYLESEVLTSQEAQRIQGKVAGLDASAAAIILQSFLDKQKIMNDEKEKKEISNEKKRISIEEFKKIEMIVGKILEVEPVPETDRLLRLTVDLGEDDSRQIISGIATFFPDCSTLRGKKCIFVGNLAPRTIRSLESDGMILAAHTEEGVFSLIVPEADVPAGTRLG